MSTPEPASVGGDHSPAQSVSPVLPPELERDIFLLAAQTSTRSVSCRLMLVASRVKTWIEPFVYRTVLLRGRGHAVRFLAALTDRPPEFAKSYVKALCIRPSIHLSLAIQLLTVCSGIESLALWILPQNDTADLSNLVSALPLTFLSLNIMSILPPCRPTFVLQNHPAFVNLSHLDIVNHWVLWKSSLGIEHLPLLTHLSFRFWSRGSVNAALATVLRQSPRLQVLVLLAEPAVIPSTREYLEKQDIQDVRVVVLKHARDIDDWEAMERNSVTMWQRAERIVRWRRLNQAGPFDFPPGFRSDLKTGL